MYKIKYFIQHLTRIYYAYSLILNFYMESNVELSLISTDNDDFSTEKLLFLKCKCIFQKRETT